MRRCTECGNEHACHSPSPVDSVSADVGAGTYVTITLDDGEVFSGTLDSVRELGFPTIRVSGRLVPLDRVTSIVA